MLVSEAIEVVGKILDSYPNGRAALAAGGGYVGALANALASYPRQVAQACADLHGLASECKFLPTVADVVAWCERKTEPLRRAAESDKRIAEQLRDREAEPNRDRRLSYDELKAKYGDPNGGWGIDVPKRQNAHQWLSAGDLAAICGEDVYRTIPERRAE